MPCLSNASASLLLMSFYISIIEYIEDIRISTLKLFSLKVMKTRHIPFLLYICTP